MMRKVFILLVVSICFVLVLGFSRAGESKRVFRKLIVGPSPSEKPQGTKAEVPMDIGIGSIVDAGRQSHGALQPGEARATFETSSNVLIIQDELPQMEVLAKFLREGNRLSVKIIDQSSLPDDLSPYQAVVVFIHGDLLEKTERAIIEYTRNGGRLVCLHHSVSSKKALNKFYFDFLGMQLDKGPMEAGGYKWKACSWSLVNLNSQHFITNSGVDWDERTAYTPSDYPSSERKYPGITLGADSEVFVNHKFTDGREKTVLCGIVYRDVENGKTYMQDRGAWIKKQGKGTIVYFLPGHAVSDYENKNISQIILNAIMWSQTHLALPSLEFP